ncbi:GRF1-interacting factor 3 isoform X1 [Prunus yedoensis var. nudiflora]|uniref:GRF1-interacting factor 3 isoform X1 n=1 Tax=Prunus yedoensis var. nudiflora TaxID=2094558 RepID=A0A314ZST2_PRUYE|nr:GRF1-interacting factor 3 isoform X1 [Prunus yedoensis var. nudiflora]
MEVDFLWYGQKDLPDRISIMPVAKYLDENKKLILAILDNQNLGKLAECAQYQAQLQKNLMYLAAIADAQPQAPTVPAQMAPHPAMQQAGYYMQHPQAAAMAQQQGIFPPKMPLQFNNPHQMHDAAQQLHQQHQQAMQGQMGMRAGGPMACLPCIILKPHLVAVVVAQLQLEGVQTMGVEEASKTTQRLGQVVMARGAQPAGMAMVMEKMESDMVVWMIPHGNMCLLIVGVFLK